MSVRIQASPEQFYHVYNRGTEKRKVFTNKRDYERFLSLLYVANGTNAVRIENTRRYEQGSTLLHRALEVDRGTPLVDITAYCLMPNHFHLLLCPRAESGVSNFVQKLSTAYTMYFNVRYERSGSLFQGKYKIRHAADDRYLKYLLAYIHLNPAKTNDPKKYVYSSYADFAGESRPQGKLLNKDVLPLYFETPDNFEKEMREWLSYGKDTKEEPVFT